MYWVNLQIIKRLRNVTKARVDRGPFLLGEHDDRTIEEQAKCQEI